MSDQASTETNMKIDPTRAKGLIEALQSVQSRVTKASTGRNVRLVAVSKLKPASDILALYQEGHRNFGENYAQELMEKVQVLPKDIKWHFIGGLQSSVWTFHRSDAYPLGAKYSSPSDNAKKATQLNLGRETLDPQPPTPLNIHIQVNTSNEASKSGVSPGSETSALAKHILATCPHLHLLGLMTIGAIARSKATVEGKENEDFTTLREERDRLEKELVEQGLLSVGKGEGGEGGLECSMGMSEDFEEAIRAGSGEVRVGSTIFGTRPKREDFNIKGDVEEAKS
ncbi:hypothetical protein WAI453_008414 [Rhynchosporium graminicola]